MAITKKPVILVHGAWHSPATAGPGDSIIGKSVGDDVKRIHEAVLPHIDAGKWVVVVAHRYGGFPATESCAGYTVEDCEAKGLEGGISAMVYITAYAMDKAGKKLADYQPADHFFDVNPQTGISTLRPHAAKQAFYAADVPRDSDRDAAARFLGDHSATCFLVPVALGAAELRVPKTYVICEHDECIAPEKQRIMAEGCGEGTRIVELAAGHSPFLATAHVETLVGEIEAAAMC